MTMMFYYYYYYKSIEILNNEHLNYRFILIVNLNVFTNKCLYIGL